MYFTAEPSPNEKFGAKIDGREQRLNATEGSLDVLSQEVRNLKRTLETAGDSPVWAKSELDVMPDGSTRGGPAPVQPS